MACSRVNYPHYLVVCEDFKHKNIQELKIDSLNKCIAISDSLIIKSEGNCQIYIEHKKKNNMNKQEFFTALDSGDIVFPETDEQIAWWDEWFDSNPSLKKETEEAMARMNEKEASEFIALKIFARNFIAENGTGLYFATVEPRKITICKHTGKLAENTPKLIIEL